MSKYIPPKKRSSKKEIIDEIDIISNNSVIDCLIKSVDGLFAVLDENRQIISVNELFLKKLNINFNDITGLRLGESIKCIHSNETKNGCGTTKYCSSCGAAIAMSSSITKNETIESKCIAKIKKNKLIKDIVFKIKTHPIKFKNKKFILIFIQDITKNENRAELENIFLHDINNILTGIIGTASMADFYENKVDKKILKRIETLSIDLKKEIDIQRLLTSDIPFNKIEFQTININIIIDKLKTTFSKEFSNKRISFLNKNKLENKIIISDLSILLRILNNMIKNALEASKNNETVKLWIENNNKTIIFCVWNKKAIPKKYQYRIFDRHFTTKKGIGHGFGTFSMKLLTESYLKGKINFTSNRKDGTTFKLYIKE